MKREADQRKNTGILRVMAAGIAVLTILLCAAGWKGLAEEAQLQRDLAGEILRFHVIANSDSEEDQAVKIKVRDAVLSYLEENMPDLSGTEETENWVELHRAKIEETAREAVPEQSGKMKVSASLQTCRFPDRTLGDLLFPAGNYRALLVEIGEAKGRNWWGILYPGLCFLDTVNIVSAGKTGEKVKNVLTEEEYSGITALSDFKINWYFRKGK